MRFLVRDNFFKSIPSEKFETVMKNLAYFYCEIEKNIKNLRNFPKGFWIKKLAGIENRYEFRVNSGDRIFFSLDRRGMEEEKITFILYSSHDHGVKKSQRADIISVREFEIVKKDFESSDVKELDKSILLDYNNVITYEIKEDDYFIKNKESKYFYYYLNDEQYNTVIVPAPVFVIGSAGSGKSTITLRKILNIEEHNNIYNFKRVGYFTGNSYLKDSLEEQYNFFREKRYKSIAEFFTLKEFYQKELGIDTRKIVNYKKFLEFLSFSFPNRKKFSVEDMNIYFEIIGILKGLMGKEGADNWERDLDVSLISFEEYRNLSKKYSVLEEEQKKYIYKIALKYEEWKNLYNFYDINDLARKAANKTQKFDFVLVDEVQDLTELEIYFLFNLVKNQQNIIFAGDIHQMVNFNSFSFDRLKNLYYKNKIRYTVSALTKNYRSSREVVQLANYMTDLRKEYIGNLGMDDYKEGAVLDEGSIILSKTDYSYIKKFQNDVNAAVIVSDEDERKKLSEDFGIKHRIFTVDEIKGLEYRDVICYNLISKNLWAWKQIFSKEVKQDQRYRKYFNIFYVGITRARKNLIIMEENIENNELLEKIKRFIKLEEKEDKKEEIVQNSVFSTKEEWLKEGIKLYKLEKYDEAQYAFEQGDYPTWIAEKNTEIDIENGDYKTALEKIENSDFKKNKTYFYKLIIDDILRKKEYIKALKYLEKFNFSYRYFDIKKQIAAKIAHKEYSVKEINKLIPYLIDKKEMIVLAEAYFSVEKYELALKTFRKILNVEGMKKSRRALWKQKFSEVSEIDKYIDELEEIIGKKDINIINKNGQTPLWIVMSQKNSIIEAEMLIYAGLNINEKINVNGEMMNCLHIALICMDIDTRKWIDFFIEKGLDINSETNKKNTALILAKKMGIDKIDKILTDYLLKKGADVNHCDSNKETVDFICMRQREIKEFKFFAERMNDIDKKNIKGKGLIDYLNEFEEKYSQEDDNINLRKTKVMKKIYSRLRLRTAKRY